MTCYRVVDIDCGADERSEIVPFAGFIRTNPATREHVRWVNSEVSDTAIDTLNLNGGYVGWGLERLPKARSNSAAQVEEQR